MIDLRSPSANVSCSVSPEHGGRIGALTVNGRQLLVSGTAEDDPMSWGCFPMVPYAGRVRDASLDFAGRTYPLRVNMAPHSIHGTVFDRPWSLVRQSDSETTLEINLGDHWPFAGKVQHRIRTSDTGLHLALTVTALESMPIQVGWHPWFVKPESSVLRFGAMFERDDRGIATDIRTDQPAESVDDCFVEPLEPLSICIDGQTVFLNSDCSCWVVFDEPDHATCIEPQTGLPNEINARPVVLEAGSRFTKTFSIETATITR